MFSFLTQIRSSSQPACSSVLRVIIPDEYNGSLQTRTLPVRPHTTTREVCRTIAHKARITNPQDYGLFKLVDGEGMYTYTVLLWSYHFHTNSTFSIRLFAQFPFSFPCRNFTNGQRLSARSSIGSAWQTLYAGL